jgi:hypothetical protein
MSLYAMVKATALGLRQRNGAFNVLISHCASNPGAKVRTVSMRQHERSPLVRYPIGYHVPQRIQPSCTNGK